MIFRGLSLWKPLKSATPYVTGVTLILMSVPRARAGRQLIIVFLNCACVKAVWAFFVPLLSGPSASFVPNCVSVFFFRFPPCVARKHAIIVFLLKTILYGVSKFRNKATFHNGTESSRAIIRYITKDITNRVKLDHFRLPAAKFRSRWVHHGFRLVVGDNRLIFPFLNR